MKHSFLSVQVLAVLVCLSLLSGCRQNAPSFVPPSSAQPAEPVELTVFAAASLTETLNQIAALYKDVAPNVTLVFNFDSSGTLKTQIQEGAACDLFLSAGQKQMDELDKSAAPLVNAESLDFVDSSTRRDLLENKVVLIVPDESEKGITSFSDVGADSISLIALGNADVPVGQYSEEIFQSLGLWEQLNADHKITFAANVKEVVAQVAAAAVDCGVVYQTDAATARGVRIAAQAPAGSHAPVVYPAAVLRTSAHPAQAEAFLAYLGGSECAEVFQSVGFSVIN